jgi:hypothetical protein
MIGLSGRIIPEILESQSISKHITTNILRDEQDSLA